MAEEDELLQMVFATPTLRTLNPKPWFLCPARKALNAVSECIDAPDPTAPRPTTEQCMTHLARPLNPKP
jgi:hypothetical protein